MAFQLGYLFQLKVGRPSNCKSLKGIWRVKSFHGFQQEAHNMFCPLRKRVMKQCRDTKIKNSKDSRFSQVKDPWLGGAGGAHCMPCCSRHMFGLHPCGGMWHFFSLTYPLKPFMGLPRPRMISATSIKLQWTLGGELCGANLLPTPLLVNPLQCQTILLSSGTLVQITKNQKGWDKQIGRYTKVRLVWLCGWRGCW